MPMPALGPKLEPPRVYPRIFEPQPGSQVCLARVQVLAIPQEGCLTLLQPYPQDEKAIACVIFVERDHESASNYPHGNYRMLLSTEFVQRSLESLPGCIICLRRRLQGASIARSGLGMLLRGSRAQDRPEPYLPSKPISHFYLPSSTAPTSRGHLVVPRDPPVSP